MSAQHRKPVVAFVLLVCLAVAVVGVRAAEAGNGRFLAAAVGVVAEVHGTIPSQSDADRRAAALRVEALGPAFAALHGDAASMEILSDPAAAISMGRRAGSLVPSSEVRTRDHVTPAGVRSEDGQRGVPGTTPHGDTSTAAAEGSRTTTSVSRGSDRHTAQRGADTRSDKASGSGPDHGRVQDPGDGRADRRVTTQADGRGDSRANGRVNGTAGGRADDRDRGRGDVGRRGEGSGRRARR